MTHHLILSAKSAITLSIFALVCGCTIDNENDISTKQSRDVDTISYFQLFSSQDPTLIAIDIMDMNSETKETDPLVVANNWDDNTYVNIPGVGDITIHNEYDLSKYSEKYKVKLQRKISTNHATQESADPNNTDTIVVLQTVEPITIYSPYVEYCSVLPLCYAQDLEVTWNEDPNNQNGVIILVRWVGAIINEPSNAQPIYHASLVPDNGVTVLNNALFDGIPNNAYVTLFLIRANIIQILYDNEPQGLEEIDWNAVLNMYPELGNQVTNVAIGAAAKLSFVLVTEL